MDLHEESVFDTIKFEKAKAMARFNRFRKVTKLLQFLEVLVALVLISWSSTKLPSAVRLSGNFLFELAGYIFNPHVVFLIGNAIIVSLFVLCRDNDAGNQNSGTGDIYDDYVRHNQAIQTQQPPKVTVPDADKTSEAPAETAGSSVDGDSVDQETKQIVCSHSEKKEEEQCDAVATAIENATKQIQKYQRTQSAKLKRDIAVRRELRRSETVAERDKSDEQREMTSFNSMDSLSIEEFNLTVDNFIRRMKTPEFLPNEELKNLTKITPRNDSTSFP